MISIIQSIANNASGVDAVQYDSTSASISVGGLAMKKRAKRDGRNPSTGARTSRKYGISTVFDIEVEPLNDILNAPIY